MHDRYTDTPPDVDWRSVTRREMCHAEIQIQVCGTAMYQQYSDGDWHADEKMVRYAVPEWHHSQREEFERRLLADVDQDGRCVWSEDQVRQILDVWERAADLSQYMAKVGDLELRQAVDDLLPDVLVGNE